MSTEARPLSYVKREEYSNRMARAFEEEQKATARRVAENEAYAQSTAKKLLEEYKGFKTEEAKKLADKSVFYVPAESNFLVVVLIRSMVDIRPKPKKVLDLFRLKRINSAVIIKNNASTRKMLQIAKDYVAFGTVDYELLRKMVYLRGHGKIGNSRVKLTNEAIEQAFNGKYRCIEELINVIYFGREDMKAVCNFLVPMRLSCPTGGFIGKKNTDYQQGGATNNHYELLGELVSRML